MGEAPWTARQRRGLAGIATAALLLRLPAMLRPFEGDVDGYTGALYAAMGRHAAEQGSLRLVMAPVFTDGTSYVHHPPLVSWATALAHAVLGASEIAYRVPFLLASLGALLLGADLARRLGGAGGGILAAVVLAVLPAAVLHGTQIEVVGAPLLLAMLGALHAWTRLRRRPGGPAPAQWLELGAWLAFGVLVDWPALLLAALLLGFELWRPAARRLPAVVVGVGLLAVLAALLAWLAAQAPENPFELLARKLWQRSFRTVSDTGDAYGLGAMALRLGSHGFWMLGVAALAPLAALLRWQRGAWRPGDEVAAVAIAFSAAFVVLALQAHLQHDFWFQAHAGTLALAAAVAVRGVGRRGVVSVALVVAAGSMLAVAGHTWRTLRTRRGPHAIPSHVALATLREVIPRDDLVAVVDRSAWPTLGFYLRRRHARIAAVAGLAALRTEPVRHDLPWLATPHPEPPRWLLVPRGVSVEGLDEVVVPPTRWRLYRVP